jgi:hypothetical protein
MRLYTPDEHYDRLRREVYCGAAPAEEAAPAAAALYTTSP